MRTDLTQPAPTPGPVSQLSNLENNMIACPGCDLLHQPLVLNIGQRALCRRCGHVLQTRKPHTIERSLAITLTSIMLILISLFTPFLSLSRASADSTISVFDAVDALWESQMLWLGALTLAFIILLPLVRLVLLAWVLCVLQIGRISSRRHLRVRKSKNQRYRLSVAFRWALTLSPWAMADIFMVGVVVSLVKISTLASVFLGPAFWALLALVAASLLLDRWLCKDTVWAELSA